MEYRQARPADESAFLALWQQVFEDGEDFARFVFTRYAGIDHIYVADWGGGCAAVLCAIPGTLAHLRGAYFYGLATDPAFRRQGLMTGLMDWTCQLLSRKGMQFTLLVPAGDHLFCYYENRGFKTTFYRWHGWMELPAVPPASLVPLVAEHLSDLRDHWLPRDAFRLAPQQALENFRQFGREGGYLTSCPEGYAVFTAAKHLVCHELQAQDWTAAQTLLAAGAALGYDKVCLSLPYPTAFPFPGSRRPLGMIRWLGEALLLDHPYLTLDSADL